MASTSKLLLLRRGDHDSRLTEGFESLLDKESMTDVSITCDQLVIRAHRTVLSIFSPFFRRVFDSITNPIHYPVIVLKDMPYADLRAIIDLMYRGEVTVTQDQFPSLKQSARVLEVSELSDIISSYEEKNDLKFKLDDSITSSGRTTRKRGRPKRYTEDDDEDYKVIESVAPPTKRQQAMQSNKSGTSLSASRPTLSALLNKPQTAIRGGLLSRQTAIRGGHSAFSKPQTATRGGVTLNKTQVATRGAYKGAAASRRRDPRPAGDDDQDFDPSQELCTVRRTGKRGRPRKSSANREDKGLPMATSLPVSLPAPVEGVDISNIFHNISDVSSSTTAPAGAPMPQPFAPTIKLEPDSDSEVECIMSGTSPLPSGVMDDMPEITENQETSVNEVSNSNAQTNDSNVIQTNSVTTEPIPDRRDSVPEVGRNQIEVNDNEANTSTINMTPNVITKVNIKTERPDSPQPDVSQTIEQIEQPIAPQVRPEDNSDSNAEIRLGLVTTTNVELATVETVSQSTAAVPSVSNELLNPEISQTSSVPKLRRIKSERITPPPEEQSSFQPIENQRQESEAISQSSIPVLTRVKSERVSPKTVANDNRSEITIDDDSNQASHEPQNVTSSRKDSADQNDASNSDIIDQTSQTNSRNGDVSTSDQQSNIDSNHQLTLPTLVETTDAQDLDVQEFAFDCFYSNDDQQMQAFANNANTSSVVTFSASNINSFGFNSQDINQSNNNQQFIPNSSEFSQIITQTQNQNTLTSTPTTIITTSGPHQQSLTADSNQQFFEVNTSQPQLTNAANTYSIDNNVVMNSPIHSDEECMLLDSPQQSGNYEVNNALDDSMDNL